MGQRTPLIEVKSLTINQAEGTSLPLSAPLHIRLQYSVARAVKTPQWSVLYEADVAYKHAVVPLLSSSLVSVPSPEIATAGDDATSFLRQTPIHSSTALLPGELYELEVYLHSIDVCSLLPETLLLQVSVLRLTLSGTAASESHEEDSKSHGEEVGNVNFVVQVGKNEVGTLMRLIMNPMK